MSKSRVVVTGLGAVSSLGEGSEALWQGLLAEEFPVSIIPDKWIKYNRPRSQVHIKAPDLNCAEWGIDACMAKQLDPITLLGIKASEEALEQASCEKEERDVKKRTWNLKGINPQRSGVFFGSGIGPLRSMTDIQTYVTGVRTRKELEKFGDKTLLDLYQMPRRFNPFSVTMAMMDAVTAYLGIRYGIQGKNHCVSAGCASGSMAVGEAFSSIQSGRLDFALAGASDYLHTNYGEIFFTLDAARVLSPCKNLEELTYCPFDERRSGLLYGGGGAGLLVLETLEHAQRRGAKILAEIVSYNDVFYSDEMMSMEAQGKPIIQLLEGLCDSVGVRLEDVDYINAHGTGTLINDAIEAAALEKVFPHLPAINSSKSMLGHTFGASGALEAVITVQSVLHQKIHACHGLKNPIRPLNFIKKAQDLSIDLALSTSYSFGGHHVALAFKPWRSK